MGLLGAFHPLWVGFPVRDIRPSCVVCYTSLCPQEHTSPNRACKRGKCYPPFIGVLAQLGFMAQLPTVDALIARRYQGHHSCF